MNETESILSTRTHAGLHAGSREAAGGEYYRAYYRELVTRGASRTAHSSRLETNKTERRRARREKWLKGFRSLASVLNSSEAVG